MIYICRDIAIILNCNAKRTEHVIISYLIYSTLLFSNKRMIKHALQIIYMYTMVVI